MPQRILMIAGPNGAGKTTMALTLIPDLPMLYEFINADEIARGLAPLHPASVALTASKLMVKRMKELLASNKSLAFETTGAGTNYLKYLHEAKRKGYEIGLMFLWLSSPEQAIQRVKERVEQGGHDVPAETVRRRYYGGLKNLIKHYLPLADRALILDNSLERGNKLIARKKLASALQIEDKIIWEGMEKNARS